jgi:hypothetical protein
MLMLKAYLDDAGKSNDPQEQICCIAGCLSPLKAWEELEQEWQQVLARFDAPYLHMKEYAQFKGPFAKWRDDHSTRKAFLSSLIDIMDKHVLSVIGTTVPIEAYSRLTERQKKGVPDPYFMCLQQTLHAAGSSAFAENMAPRSLQVPDPRRVEKVQIIFSRQDEFKSKADALYEAMQESATIGPMLGDFNWASFRDIIPLQAADLVAYEMKRFAGDLLVDTATEIRTPMKRLFGMNPLFSFLNYNEIVKKFYFGALSFQH